MYYGSTEEVLNEVTFLNFNRMNNDTGRLDIFLDSFQARIFSTLHLSDSHLKSHVEF